MLAGLLLSGSALMAQSQKPDKADRSDIPTQETQRSQPGFKVTVYGEREREPLVKKIFMAPVREFKSTAIDMITCRDRLFCAAAWSYVGAYAADMITTERVFNRCPTCIEGGPMFTDSRAAGSIAAAWGGVTITNLTFTHFWKRKMKEPVLHQMWPAGLIYQGANHVWGAQHNERLNPTLSGSPGLASAMGEAPAGSVRSTNTPKP